MPINGLCGNCNDLPDGYDADADEARCWTCAHAQRPVLADGGHGNCYDVDGERSADLETTVRRASVQRHPDGGLLITDGGIDVDDVDLDDLRQQPSTTSEASRKRCPECGSVQLSRKVSDDETLRKKDGKYTCDNCRAHFDEPLEPAEVMTDGGIDFDLEVDDVDLDELRYARSSTPRHERNRCPNCSNANIRRTNIGVDGGEATDDWYCETCGVSFPTPITTAADGGEVQCGRRTCDDVASISFTNQRGAIRTRCAVHALADGVDRIGETRAEQIMDEFDDLEELAKCCEGADGTHAPPRISRLDGFGPGTASTLAKNIDESPVVDSLGSRRRPMTDGGSKYVIETGDGYQGVHKVRNYQTNLSLGLTEAVEWRSGSKIVAIEVDDGIALVDEDVDDPLWRGTVRENNSAGPVLSVGGRPLQSLDLQNGDVRLYDRPDGGLLLVRADDDPRLQDGGRDA